MRLGIIGKGKIVKNLMETKAQLPVEAMALLVRKEALDDGRDFARQYGMEAVFTEFEALAAWKPDAVYVAVPNHLHYQYTKAALSAGCNVILEKPACSTAAELAELIALAREKGVYLVEAMTTWYLPAFEALRASLPALGRLRLVSLNYCQRSSRYDAFREGRVLPAFDPAASGGSVMDINIYNIAAAVWLFGAPEKVSYYANVERGIDTSGTAILHYGDFQVVAMGAKDCGLVAGGTFLGDEGTISFDGPVSLVSAFSGKAQFEVPNPPHRMLPEFLAFDEILQGKRPEVYSQNLQNSLIVANILDECRRQTGVRFPADV